ncbi:MAG: ECF transporter S component [Armatimonadota bacterium]|nr:ECF transporter S component [Armatimonadota bacterium]
MRIRHIISATVFAAVYVITGQFVHLIPNPMVPGAIIALNMVVIVIAGILFGPGVGAIVGLAGTAVNGFLTASGNPFEQAAVIPHIIMGIAAGLAARRSVMTGSLTILVGHGLNVYVFLARGLMPADTVFGPLFLSGLLFETVVDVVVVLFAVPLLRPLLKPAQA